MHDVNQVPSTVQHLLPCSLRCRKSKSFTTGQSSNTTCSVLTTLRFYHSSPLRIGSLPPSERAHYAYFLRNPQVLSFSRNEAIHKCSPCCFYRDLAILGMPPAVADCRP